METSTIVSSSSVEGIRVGDEIKQVRLTSSSKDWPDYLADLADDSPAIESLRKGWEFSPVKSLISLDRTLQVLPVGSELEIVAKRPAGDGESSIVTAATELAADPDGFRFIRGLVRPGREDLRIADGPADALRLGLAEGGERFADVLDFLGMAGQGQLKLRHVGGPLMIFEVAKNESEAGISRLLVFLTLLSMNLAILNFCPSQFSMVATWSS